MKVKINVKRFDPKARIKTSLSNYVVEVEATNRVIDALEKIARTDDPTLSFRRSCAHGVCGSDAMRINGQEMLACKALFQDLATEENNYTLNIEPLNHLKVEKDLIVDQTPFFEKYKSVKPYFVPVKDLPEAGEYIQSAEERKLIDEASTCIACGACYSACDVLDHNPNYVGPMALVQAVRFIDDSRDKGLEVRLDVLDHVNGVWACEGCFDCTKACPRGIKVTKIINLLKRKITKYREARSETTQESHAVTHGACKKKAL